MNIQQSNTVEQLEDYTPLHGEFRKEMEARRLRDDTAEEVSPVVVALVVLLLVVVTIILIAHPHVMAWADINTK